MADVQVYRREFSKITCKAEEGIGNEVFTHKVVDDSIGFGELLCLTTSSELAHVIAKELNTYLNTVGPIPGNKGFEPVEECKGSGV